MTAGHATREGDTELETPIKIQWNPGKLRSRIQERAWDAGATKQDGEWVPNYDGEDVRAAYTFATLSRQKTNVVIKTEEEAEHLYSDLGWYSDGAGRGGIHWMNGAMQSSVRRVRREILDALEERGVTVTHDSALGTIAVGGGA